MTARTTIFISAYRNFSIRYILYSDIFNELRKRDFKFVVFVKDNDVDYYRDRLGGENVIVESVLFQEAMSQIRSTRVGMWFSFLRKGMSGRAKGYRNTTDEVIVSGLIGRTFGTAKGRLVFRALRLIIAVGNRVKAVRKGLLAFESKMFPGRMYDFYFRKYKPAMLIVSSLGYMIDPYIMRAAKRHGCDVVSIPHSWDNTSTKDYRGGDPDHVITWNEIMKREVNVFHDVAEKAIHVGGIAHWDMYFDGAFEPGLRSEFFSTNGLSQDRKLIFFGTSSPVTFTRTFDVIEGLADAIDEGRFLFPCQLLVRLHPVYLLPEKQHGGRFIDRFRQRIETLGNRHGSPVCFANPQMKVLNDDIDMPIEDMRNLARTLHYSDVMLTEYSTLMIEGAIFDLPVINVGLHNFWQGEERAFLAENLTHINRILRTGATKDAHTMDQLVEYINYYLKDRSGDEEKRRDLVAQEVTTNPGRAGKNIADHIAELVERGTLRGETVPHR